MSDDSTQGASALASGSDSDFRLAEVLAFAIDTAREAGKFILQGSEKRFRDQDEGRGDFEDILKKNTADLVTETDQKVEKIIRDAIAQKYPTHKFIGEESWAAGEEPKLEEAPTWIVDPIDGTTNFVIGLPMCCVSIGVTYKCRPVIGVVYNPFLDHLYAASKGNGSWFHSPVGGRKQLPLSKNALPLPNLKRAVIAEEWGSDRKIETVSKKATAFTKLAGDPDAGVKGGQMVSGVRSLGSAALSCCYVAQGSLDLWHEVGCWAWDVCAGIVIVEEAGGVVVGSKASSLASLDSHAFGDVTPDVLQGRKFLVVRNIGADKASGESTKAAQKRIVKTFYDSIDEWDAV